MTRLLIVGIGGAIILGFTEAWAGIEIRATNLSTYWARIIEHGGHILYGAMFYEAWRDMLAKRDLSKRVP